MTKLKSTKKAQQTKAVLAHSAHISYSLVDLDSSKEYVDSNDNSKESSDDNFMELDDLGDANLIIETLTRKNKAFKEAAIESYKITQFFSNALPMVNNDQSYKNFQDQNNQGDDELNKELNKELDKKKKKSA
ncbi:18192_t:CDS:2, partial [Dentiscutata erythropus]